MHCAEEWKGLGVSTEDKDAVEAVALEYYEAMLAGDSTRTRAVFSNDARFWGVRDGEPIARDLDEFVFMIETPAQVSQSEVGIKLVDCAGDVAIVKLVDRFRSREYTDYLSLVRGADGWRIVAKTFWAHPESGH